MIILLTQNPLNRNENNNRILKNTFTLYFRTFFVLLITLFTSRIILNVLGIEDHGIYSVIGGVVYMFAFFNSAMSNATQRFLSFEIGKGNIKALRATFNASQNIHLFIGIIIILFAETIGVWLIKEFLVIPPTRLPSALWVFHFTVFSFVISILQVPYMALVIAKERMNIYALISVLDVLLKLGISLLLYKQSADRLKLYGTLYFVVVTTIFITYYIYVRFNYSESKFQIIKDKSLYKKLIQFTGWSLFGNIATITKTQGINILLNIYFGPVINSARAIANQVNNAVNTFGSSFQMSLNPQIIKNYATGNMAYMQNLVYSGSKISFFLLYIITIPILLETELVLKYWLNIVPEYTVIFTKLILIVVLIDCLSGPIMTAVQATGKIKYYQIIVGSLQLSILPLSFILIDKGFSPEITIFINIIISIIALYFRLTFLNKLIGFSIRKYFKEVIIKIISITVLTIIPPLIICYCLPPSFARFIFISLSSITFTILLIFFIGLNKTEKNLILKVFKKVYSNIK